MEIEIGKSYTFYCEMQQEYEAPESRLRRFTGTEVAVLCEDFNRDTESGKGYIVRAHDGTEFGVHAEEINGWDYERDQFFWSDGTYGKSHSDEFLSNERTTS